MDFSSDAGRPTPPPPPAKVGMAEDEVDTPALIIDLDAFERNLDRMAAFAGETGIRVRPHAKTHKSARIAALQMERGAVGVCCQKLSEAEALAAQGIGDILISNQVVGAGKLKRLADLAGRIKLGVLADDGDNVDALAAAAQAACTQVDVLVELDVGAGRCGVSTAEDMLSLAKRIDGHASLNFGGLQAYHGKAQHLRTSAERQAAITGAAKLTADAVTLLNGAGLTPRTVGGAGTGTYTLETAAGPWNEIQPGSYIFMDADYAQNRDGTGAPFTAFEHALFVLVTVMSAVRPGIAVVDAGHKALSNDQGFPTVWDHPAITYGRPSDEHGVLSLGDPAPELAVGQKLRLVPGHCDPTVNLHDWYVGVRDGKVEALWPVTARGRIS